MMRPLMQEKEEVHHGCDSQLDYSHCLSTFNPERAPQVGRTVMMVQVQIDKAVVR
jgi:hypothetical protein